MHILLGKTATYNNDFLPQVEWPSLSVPISYHRVNKPGHQKRSVDGGSKGVLWGGGGEGMRGTKRHAEQWGRSEA